MTDFGAASFKAGTDSQQSRLLERLEVRAFGCLVDDLLGRVDLPDEMHPSTSCFEFNNAFNNALFPGLESLRKLQEDCFNLEVDSRPGFNEIFESLEALSTES